MHPTISHRKTNTQVHTHTHNTHTHQVPSHAVVVSSTTDISVASEYQDMLVDYAAHTNAFKQMFFTGGNNNSYIFKSSTKGVCIQIHIHTHTHTHTHYIHHRHIHTHAHTHTTHTTHTQG